MPSSGVWLARMPIEPVSVRVETISTSPLKTSPSGVRTSAVNVVRAIPGSALRGGLGHLLDGALQEEGRLRQVVVLAVDQLAERADRLGDRHVRTRGAREDL